MAFNVRNGLSIQSAIDTTFLDTAHFDAECEFPRGFDELNKLAISTVGGLRPFILEGVCRKITFAALVFYKCRPDSRECPSLLLVLLLQFRRKAYCSNSQHSNQKEI